MRELKWACKCGKSGSCKLHPPTFDEFISSYLAEGHSVTCPKCKRPIPAEKVLVLEGSP